MCSGLRASTHVTGAKAGRKLGRDPGAAFEGAHMAARVDDDPGTANPYMRAARPGLARRFGCHSVEVLSQQCFQIRQYWPIPGKSEHDPAAGDIFTYMRARSQRRFAY